MSKVFFAAVMGCVIIFIGGLIAGSEDRVLESLALLVVGVLFIYVAIAEAHDRALLKSRNQE